MYETKYHKASSVADAISLIGKSDDGKLPELWISNGQIFFFERHFGFLIFQTICNEAGKNMYEKIYG